jgi:hypothetical protein
MVRLKGAKSKPYAFETIRYRAAEQVVRRKKL